MYVYVNVCQALRYVQVWRCTGVVWRHFRGTPDLLCHMETQNISFEGTKQSTRGYSGTQQASSCVRVQLCDCWYVCQYTCVCMCVTKGEVLAYLAMIVCRFMTDLEAWLQLMDLYIVINEWVFLLVVFNHCVRLQQACIAQRTLLIWDIEEEEEPTQGEELDNTTVFSGILLVVFQPLDLIALTVW